MVVWLITWEWIGEHARIDDKIAAILNYRLSDQHVSEIMEMIYVNCQLGLQERLEYAQHRRRNFTPPTHAVINGMPFAERIICGDNPHLYARKVDNFRVVQDGIEERPLWDERPDPDFPRIG